MLNVLLPIICDIVNKSIMGFTMPNAQKEAIVRPLIRKTTLDPENLKNFRPGANLPYLGKLIENVVINQIDDHLAKHQLHEPLQSAYTPNHSTETVIVRSRMMSCVAWIAVNVSTLSSWILALHLILLTIKCFCCASGRTMGYQGV